MFVPIHVQLKYWFYPIGNTPAVNLLRDLAPADEQETVRFLALGCGDPRNVLFSLWCEQGHTTKRTLDFTCCDIEPAILARNVVLFTLIIEQASAAELWELFYHFYVTGKSLITLRDQATRLLDASESIEKWASSPYGTYVRFVNQDTLQQTRQYWVHYRSGQAWKQAHTAIAKRSKEIGEFILLTGVRAAGPFWFHATSTMAHVYRRYWETGVAGGNKEDLSRLAGSREVNPLFAASSSATGEFAVHYGIEPMLGFHLAEAFQDSNLIKQDAAGIHANQVVKIANAQFKSWCDSFQKYVKASQVHVNLFCGEALALSHELQLALAIVDKPAHVARTYTRPWTACPLLLDGQIDFHEPFDVIDTSNLGDHLGSINVLTATAPLLRRSPSAVLYNESLLMASEDISASLTTILGSDVATFLLLIGLVPGGLVAGATVDGVGNEAGIFSMQTQTEHARQYRMRVSWKCPEYADSAATKVLASSGLTLVQAQFDAKDLAECLFGVYKAMFAHEDMTKMMARMTRMQTGHYSDDLQRYTRAAIVALLRIVKTRVEVNWVQVMTYLYDRIEHDRALIVGSNSLQELGMHLHLCGVWTTHALNGSPEQLRSNLGSNLRSPKDEIGILAEKSPPPIVCLVMVIPRQKLEIFTEKSPDVIGTPALHVSVCQSQGRVQYENCFYSFYSFFGSIKSNSHGMDTSVVEEDERGWAGSSDLVVSCAVPTFGLLTGPKNGIRVALMINTSPANIMNFRHLGPRLTVFEAGLTHTDTVFVCRDAPRLHSVRSWSMQNQWIKASTTFNSSSIKSLVRLNNEARATHLQIHIDFRKDLPESKALSSGAEVKALESSSCTMSVHIGDKLKRIVAFPFPIGSPPKTRVARKSSWIEVEVPIFTALDGDRFDSWTQLVPESGQRFVCWSVPRISVEAQPMIRFPPKGDSKWIQTFMGTTLSDAERVLNAKGGQSSFNAKLDLKQSINILFAAFAGLHPQAKGAVKTFQLAIESTGCHTVIFPTAVRHDLDLGSIVMEAYVVPLTIPRVQELHSALGQLQDTVPLGINLSKQESTLFKRMLPALAERCRTWKHKPKCPYLAKGAPVSLKDGDSPLCGCGEGKISGAELAKLGVKEWAPFAKYATRIAIAPIFPVPYVESSLSEFKGRSISKMGKAEKSNSAATTTDKCGNCGTSSGSLKACGACGKVKYCGQACQKAAWKEHKGQCKKA